MTGEVIQLSTRAEWRRWLSRNHQRTQGIWLVSFKKNSGQPGIRYEEAVEEALCFGWIDSLPKKLDDLRWQQWYSPRKPKSVWSKINKERIERLIASGKMRPPGLQKIEAAKADGSWTALDSAEALEIPPDLAAAFRANPPALGYFDAFPRSVKRGLLGYLSAAKRPETRAKRIQVLVEKAAANRRAWFDRDA
jgi:uncharacterized protein YdeI (YjbR/CyaY-like superfamily)